MSEKTLGAVRYDFILVAVVLLLTLLGLVTLYSASYLFAWNSTRFEVGLNPLDGNLTACLIMLFMFPALAAIKIDFMKNRMFIFIIVAFTVCLNILPLLPAFRSPNYRDGSAMRWIYIKQGGKALFSFQPSELVKIALPLYLMYTLDKNKDRLNSFLYGFVPPFFITGLFCALIVLQKNLSDAVLIAISSLIICFAAGLRVVWFVVAVPFMVIFAFMLINTNDTWKNRLENMGQEFNAEGKITQLGMSRNAIRAGGFWGRGIGQGELKITMPEVHNDFVFSSYAEETGFLGVLAYLALVGSFSGIGYLAAWRNRDRFFQLMAFALVTPITVQTLLNIAVVAGVIPVTGVPLPFVSSGGTSLFMTLASAALLVNVTRRMVISDKKEVR